MVILRLAAIMSREVSVSIGRTDECDNPTTSAPEYESGNPSEIQSGLSKDAIFSLLSVERRRRVLTYLADHGDETTLNDLAEHIAAVENNTEIYLLSSQQRKRVYISLYQDHLPKLADADVIDYDQSRGTVKRGPSADLLYPYLAIDPEPLTADGSPQSGENTTL